MIDKMIGLREKGRNENSIRGWRWGEKSNKRQCGVILRIRAVNKSRLMMVEKSEKRGDQSEEEGRNYNYGVKK